MAGVVDFDYPVRCPLMGTKIDMGTCFDIHMVVCGEAPKWSAPEKIFKTDDFEYVCNSCRYHRYD